MADENLLQSWKEIAAYLGRSERTCRRWETEFRLPVRRMDGSLRGSVFAYKSELDKWMDEVLHGEEEPSSIEPRPRPRNYPAIILILSVILACALALVVFRIRRSQPQSPASFQAPTLAILPFRNSTGDESLDFWGNALADLLVNDLSQSRYLRVLPQDRVFFILQDLDLLDVGSGAAIALEEVAVKAHVDNIVVGNFVRAGQRFRISASLRHMPSGEAVVLPSVEARSQEEILVKIDELATGIKSQLLSPAHLTARDDDLEAGRITTSSIEAYRYYIDARSSFHNGRAAEAIESLERAVALDPGFAMAYSYLATCYYSVPGRGHEDKAEEALSRAFELSHHASPRERFYIQARYYRSRRRSWGQYLKTCREFVGAYPDDARAALCLAEAYVGLEEWDRAVETLEGRIGAWDSSAHFTLLQRAYRAQGKYEEALAVAEAAPAERYPLQYPHQLALNMIYEGKFERALLEADKMLERTPGNAPALTVKGDVHFYRAEWDQAEVYYRELLTPVGPDFLRLWLRHRGLFRLVSLYLARGQLERALDLTNQAIDEVTALGERKWLFVFREVKAEVLLAQGDLSGADAEIRIALEETERRGHVSGKVAVLHTHGMILLEMGNVGGAERAAAEMKAEIDGWLNPRLMRIWHHLAGHVDLARNDVGQAAEHFERAVSLVPHQQQVDGGNHGWYYSSLASAYYLLGDLARAQEWYEKALALTSGRLCYGHIYAKSHFMLGKIYEQRGMNEDAIRCYRTFLDLWREADSAIPDLEEAKQSLAALLQRLSDPRGRDDRSRSP